MTNPYYNHGSIPADNSLGSSAEIRAEFDSVATGFAKLPTLSGNGGKVVKVNAGGSALETKASDAEQADTVTAATAKTTPVDADYVGIVDSAASNVLKKLTFANLWAWIQSKLNGATAKTTPTGADTIPLSDSAAAGATKKLSITNLVSYLSGLCSSGWNAATATTATNSGTTGTFTIQSSDFTVGMSGTATWYKNNNIVHLHIPQDTFNGTSDTGLFQLSTLPAEITPTSNHRCGQTYCKDNGVLVSAEVFITSGGVIALSLIDVGWTASGTKRLYGTDFTWSLD